MKKIILLLFLLCFYSNCYAVKFYYDNEKVDNMFITRSSMSESASGNPYVLKMVDSNDFVYCIEPLKQLDKVGEYIEYNFNNYIFSLQNNVLEKINLIAYYGYGYKNHEDIKWYGITQYLIWKEIFPYLDISFVDSRFGEKINAYNEEVNEVIDLVNKDILGFNIKDEYFMTANHEYEIITSDLLNDYDVESSTDLIVFKKSNSLILQTDVEGTYFIKLKRKNRRNNNYLLYYSKDGQNLFMPGVIDDTKTIKIHVSNANLIINKRVDTDNKNIKVDGSIYGIYDSNHNLIKEEEIKDNQIVLRLPLDTYYVRELKPGYGCLIDNTEYKINLVSDYELNIEEPLDIKNVTIHKYYKDDVLYDEEGALFYLYLDSKLLGKYETDREGKIYLNLEYGNYKLVQANGKEGYCYSTDLEFLIDSNTSTDEIVIIDEKEKIVEEEKIVIDKQEENKDVTSTLKLKNEVLGKTFTLKKEEVEEVYDVPDTRKTKKINYMPLFSLFLLFKYAFNKNY